MNEDRPNCKCHGEPMLWKKDARGTRGGYWRCAVKYRAANVRHYKTEKYRAAQARYNKSEKRRAAKARYNKSEKGRASGRAARARYYKTEKGRAAQARYERSRLRVQAGKRFSYRIAPEKTDEIKAKLAEFREQQSRTRKEKAEHGWID